jgi:hypothetical protein
MTGIEHSILATAMLAGFYFWGKWVGRKEKVEDVIEHTLDTLEQGNYIKVIVQKNGDKELIPLDKC